MKTVILTLAFIFGTVFINAQEVQNRSLAPFDKMDISGIVHVTFVQSDSFFLTVKAKAREIEQVGTRVENSTLFISSKGRFMGPINVYVRNPALKQLQVSGAATFECGNELQTDSLLLSLSGAGNAYFTIKALKIKSVQSGASLLTLAGNTDHLDAELSGASILFAYELVSKTANIFTTGASTAKIYVANKLKATATGASSIKIKGEVTDISAEAGSASSITKIRSNGKNYSDNHRDSTVYNWRGRKIIVMGRDRSEEDSSISEKRPFCRSGNFKHWAGITIGVNGFMAPGGGINLPSKSNYMELNYSRSFNFQFNLLERQFNIVQDYFKIVTGLGLDYHSYELKNKTSLNPDSAYTGGKIDSSGKYSYDKNRLRNTYIQVPLLLEFNTSKNPHKTFHIALGVLGEYLISSRTRQVLELDKFEIVRTRKDSYNMSPFIAKAHVNVGYRGWTIFGEYNLTPLFQGAKGPELYPFSVGIRVIPFG